MAERPCRHLWLEDPETAPASKGFPELSWVSQDPVPVTGKGPLALGPLDAVDNLNDPDQSSGWEVRRQFLVQTYSPQEFEARRIELGAGVYKQWPAIVGAA